jgi:DDE superfamily endonuclease
LTSRHTPRKITDAKVEEAVTQTLESLPPAATHWSTRSLAQKVGLSQSAVVLIWHSFGLQPYQSETFKLSTDPWLVEKVRDIVGLYLNPPEHAFVWCADEKSQVQALDGLTEQRTNDYERHGTTSLFAALDIATGKVIGKCHRRHRHQEFLKFMEAVDSMLPSDAGEIHLVLDNNGTHKTPKVVRWFAPPSAIPVALHSDQRLLGESGGAMVCKDHRATDSVGLIHQRPQPREGGLQLLSRRDAVTPRIEAQAHRTSLIRESNAMRASDPTPLRKVRWCPRFGKH